MIRQSMRLVFLILGVLLAFGGCSDDGAKGGATTGTGGTLGTAAIGVGAAGVGVAPGTAGRVGGAAGTTSAPPGAAGIGVGAAGRVGGTAGISNPPGAAGRGAMPAAGGTGAGTPSGTSGAPGGTAGAGTAGVSGPMTGAGGTGMMPPAASGMGCTPPPSTAKFQVMTKSGGPGGNYTIVQPRTLGEGGFKHPPVAWGNGLATTPSLYVELLNSVAENGFVVIANPGTGSDPQVVRQGLEWLIAQGESGEYSGKLAKNCAGTIGYSMGGGAAVGSGSHPEVRAIVSIHGLPDQSARASGPILLTTSDDDGFVTKGQFVMPCYNSSSVQPTILATHIENRTADFTGHLEPLGNGGKDAGPAVAWLRYWLYGDQAQKEWFYGANCKLCQAPWAGILRKNHTWE